MSTPIIAKPLQSWLSLCVASLIFLGVSATGGAQRSAERPQARFVVPIARIDRTYLRNEATIQGTITSYKASWRETAPHSFVLSDGTGNLRIAVWPNVWEKIPFKDRLKQEGQEITARVTIAEFRGALEGHLDKADQIWLGLAAPHLAKPLVPTSAQARATTTAPPLNWRKTIDEALEEAKKTNRNIVILFANPESDNGRYVEEKIFGDPLIRTRLAEKYVAVRIDMRTDAELARRLQAFRAGTVGFYSSAGQPLRQHLVPRNAEELFEALK